MLPLNGNIIRQLGIPLETRGVVISAVDQSTDAAARGLQRGDVILTANMATTTEAEPTTRWRACARQGVCCVAAGAAARPTRRLHCGAAARLKWAAEGIL